MRNQLNKNLCQLKMEAVFVKNQKGGLLLKDQQNQKYRIHHTNNDETKAWYQCVKRALTKCSASAVLLINENISYMIYIKLQIYRSLP